MYALSAQFCLKSPEFLKKKNLTWLSQQKDTFKTAFAALHHAFLKSKTDVCLQLDMLGTITRDPDMLGWYHHKRS
jgi:cob(I)alamin adenosyltransferase